MRVHHLLIPLFAVAAMPVCAQEAKPNSPAPDTAKAPAESADSAADKAWAAILETRKAPANPPKSQEERLKLVTERRQQLQEKGKDFLAKFPKDPRRWGARMMMLQTSLTSAESLTPEVEKEAETIANGEDAETATKSDARMLLMQIHRVKLDTSSSDLVTKLDNEMQAFAKDFPTHPFSVVADMERAELWATLDTAKEASLLELAAKSTNEQVAAEAKKRIDKKEKLKKPLDISFKDIEGKQVSLAEMKGKVVLIDFWATWCGPCVAEIPNVVAVYNKFKDKGFEIIGISLDQDKDALTKFVKEKNMPWPQYFDGKGWQNEISQRYGIESIPAMWLVDKDGKVVSTEARSGLEALVEKHLGAK